MNHRRLRCNQQISPIAQSLRWQRNGYESLWELSKRRLNWIGFFIKFEGNILLWQEHTH